MEHSMALSPLSCYVLGEKTRFSKLTLRWRWHQPPLESFADHSDEKLGSESNKRAPFPNAAGHEEAKRESVPGRVPNIGLQATAKSLRSFVAAALGGA